MNGKENLSPFLLRHDNHNADPSARILAGVDKAEKIYGASANRTSSAKADTDSVTSINANKWRDVHDDVSNPSPKKYRKENLDGSDIDILSDLPRSLLPCCDDEDSGDDISVSSINSNTDNADLKSIRDKFIGRYENTGHDSMLVAVFVNQIKKTEFNQAIVFFLGLCPEDIKAGRSSERTPQQLQTDRPEYKQFLLTVFRRHIYQEQRKQREMPLKIAKRNKLAEKKHQQEAEAEALRWNARQNSTITGN